MYYLPSKTCFTTLHTAQSREFNSWMKEIRIGLLEINKVSLEELLQFSAVLCPESSFLIPRTTALELCKRLPVIVNKAKIIFKLKKARIVDFFLSHRGPGTCEHDLGQKKNLQILKMSFSSDVTPPNSDRIHR